ncbi:flagellar hook-associated protein FlgK [Methylobacterium sp. Leaf93]|uniref:flagellar hook-associated protein FlgK n=1 Tax=Methylobacterium sp. Leaf93 TaxID=1736249 RepID=UPI00070121FF|nr:flagellar hook-associated protein FlgK [Methylobacterium sp. Leaf93]KQP04031.1 flagellar biosynthesis protein FlgK [Methylobacterium sp. Leaf93]
MSFSALNTAAAGLKTTQAAIGIVSQNIANVGTTGYVKRSLDTVAQGPGNSGVAIGTINRVFDENSVKQLRLETSGASYTSMMADVRTQLDKLYGTPGTTSALDGVMNSFTLALQTLGAAPDSAPARSAVVAAASNLATKIGSIAEGVQSLRTATESQLSNDTSAASGLLSSIAQLNVKIAATSDDGSKVALLDQRDQALNSLSGYLDVQASVQRDGTVTVMTNSGMTLVDRASAASLSFGGRGTLGPEDSYSADPAQRGVGTITATTPGGGTIDLVASNAIRSGSLAAGIELRDTVLPQAQRQLDDLAAGLSRSLSDTSAVGTPASTTTGAGFDIDLTGLSAGNAITVSLKDDKGAQRNLILVPSKLNPPAAVNRTDVADPLATIVPFTLESDPAKLGASIAAALGSSFTVTSNGTVGKEGAVRILTPANGATTIQGISASVTQSKTADDVTNGKPQIPLFVDGGGQARLFTGSFDGGSQLTGFAQRIAVNPAVAAKTESLVKMSSSTPANDVSRPQYLHNALTTANRTFSAASGIGGISAPFTTSVQDFTQKIIDAQGAATATAQFLDEGQSIALATAQSRFAGTSGVKIDEEMSKLVGLQTAYTANARVLTAARDMLDTLLRI